MDIVEIENTIEELQNSDTTFGNCYKLASLYIVKEYLHKSSEEVVVQEYDDILPAYHRYSEIRREYQLGMRNEESVVHAFAILCQEIEEFLGVLYVAIHSPEEKILMQNALDRVFQKLQ